MTEEHVKELNSLREDLGVHLLLYRNVWAYAIAFVAGYYNRELSNEYSYQIVKRALEIIANGSFLKTNDGEFGYRQYAKEVVNQAAGELGIKDPTKEQHVGRI